MKSAPRRWLILALLMALCFISHLNRLAMSVAGTERIIPQFNLTPEKMGWVYTSFLLCYTAGMIAGGWCIDRWGPRKTLLAMGLGSASFGALTGGLGFGLVGTASFLTGLLVVRGCMGLFTTPLHPACARAVSNWFPAKHVSGANGLVTFAAVLGMASTWPLFGALMDWLDWPGAFMVASGTLIAITLLWGIAGKDHLEQMPIREAGVPDSVQNLPAGRSPLLSRSLVLLTLSYSAVGYFQYLFFYWSEYYFKDVMHLPTVQSRHNTMFLVLALGVGMPVGGWLADRTQRRYPGRMGWAMVPGIAMAMSAGFLFLGVAAREPFWIVTLFALAMFALGASESSFWQAAVVLGGPRGGTTAAIMNTGGNGIGLLAPLLTPVISAALGWQWGICVGGIVGIIGALCWWGIDPTGPVANGPRIEPSNP
ncbi:MAG TPA: MFS transporter [Verrucomicrobiales bacterium]|nr:MFS transporter [Verrucomicrobiales bacterium]